MKVGSFSSSSVQTLPALLYDPDLTRSEGERHFPHFKPSTWVPHTLLTLLSLKSRPPSLALISCQDSCRQAETRRPQKLDFHLAFIKSTNYLVNSARVLEKKFNWKRQSLGTMTEQSKFHKEFSERNIGKTVWMYETRPLSFTNVKVLFILKGPLFLIVLALFGTMNDKNHCDIIVWNVETWYVMRLI